MGLASGQPHPCPVPTPTPSNCPTLPIAQQRPAHCPIAQAPQPIGYSRTGPMPNPPKSVKRCWGWGRDWLYMPCLQ